MAKEEGPTWRSPLVCRDWARDHNHKPAPAMAAALRDDGAARCGSNPRTSPQTSWPGRLPHGPPAVIVTVARGRQIRIMCIGTGLLS